MRRREFITLVSAAAWPVAGRAKTLDLEIPATLLARADEAIE
jgi:hypothetical protein